jgi:hypothetical protein
MRLVCLDSGDAATVVRSPLRRSAAVLVVRERDGDGWYALARGHGWLFGSLDEARDEAHWLSRNLGLPVREIAG